MPRSSITGTGAETASCTSWSGTEYVVRSTDVRSASWRPSTYRTASWSAAAENGRSARTRNVVTRW